MTKTTHIVLGAPDSEAIFPKPDKEDIVIGVDGGAIECLQKGIPLNIALGDFDSISPTEKENLKKYAECLKEFDTDKDDTDGELAVELAMTSYESDEIVIYNWLGGRLDHLMNLLFMVHQPRFDSIIDKIRFENEHNTISFYKAGQYRIEKEASKKYVSFIGMTPLKKITLNHVKYPLKEKSYSYPTALVSNEIEGDFCDLIVEEGIVAVVQSADRN